MHKGTSSLRTEPDCAAGPVPNATVFIFGRIPIEASEISKNEVTPYTIVSSDIEVEGQLVDLSFTDTYPQRPWVVEKHCRSVST